MHKDPWNSTEGDLLDSAWGLIANANEGFWDRARPEWREAAMRWRDQYHEWMKSLVTVDLDPPDYEHELHEAMKDPDFASAMQRVIAQAREQS